MSPALADRSPISIDNRVRLCTVAALVGLLVLLLRLWFLQILNGDYFRLQSENNRIRNIFVPPPRGEIRDREGRVLARNRPSFNLELVLEDAPDPKQVVRRAAELLNRPIEELESRFQDTSRRRRFEPRLLAKDLTRDEVATISAHRWDLPGAFINTIPAREYVYGASASHVLGYTREISKTQLDQAAFAGYRPGDVIGQDGVESSWEQYLRGKRGIQSIVVNATGARIDEASYDREQIGHTLQLTLDIDLQQVAEQAMRVANQDPKSHVIAPPASGAVVALNPNTGEVLALVSNPGYDPNAFVGEMPPGLWQTLNDPTERPMHNRALQGTYPPGSVFKIFVAIAGFAEGNQVYSTHDHTFCPGYLQVGNRKFKCHKHTGHGIVDHISAMAESCDVMFYQVGLRLGPDRIHDYATQFGFGAKTGIDLSDESEGLIPSTEWKKKAYKNPADQKWYQGETPSIAIGQGAVSVTPIQVARAVSAVVNGGKLLRPQIVQKLYSMDGQFSDSDFKPEIQSQLEIEPWIFETLKKEMVAVVNDPHGTGKNARLPPEFGILVGGKSGTSQVTSGPHSSGKFQDHAWFVAFAPVEKPEIVVAAIVENGGHGGAVAAPVVRAVMQRYFEKTRGIIAGPQPRSKTEVDNSSDNQEGSPVNVD